MPAATDGLTFHQGPDDAVIVRRGRPAAWPVARLYGNDRDVTRYGHLFAAAYLDWKFRADPACKVEAWAATEALARRAAALKAKLRWNLEASRR